MATQQVLFKETIAGMKKAFKRKAYESDSDSEIDNYSNRGHKLKRRARFAHKGQLVPSSGPSSYKEIVEYAGVRRAIIQRNPPLLDDEGYEVDSDDEARVDEAIAASAPLNPYANIRLEQILSPLTASTDLPTHPTLSKPFTSKTLTELIRQSCSIMRKENQSLWKVRHLWTALSGDGTWMPCENMVRPDDIELYTEDHVARHLLSLSRSLGEATSPTAVNGEPQPERNNATNGAQEITENGDTSMLDVSGDGTEARQDDTAESHDTKNGRLNKAQDPSDKPVQDGKKTEDGAVEQGEGNEKDKLKSIPNGPGESSVQGTPQLELPNEMVDKAHMAGPGAQEQPFVHPIFLPPVGAKPDRDLGLPEYEAEDVRRLLALYVQKQEEVCRGAKRLHEGLLRAERLRKEVLHWSKAEAHCGPNRDMSDGEDWYDKEEWGLTEDLKKGQDEEEEDTTTQGKKTRNRR
ncbi:RXT2-like protein [Stachybotrys elegans]|uniref:RXT2-like protein n=1 Tax=Stachybotrys elegans TaxID=80388 RepID=A0A8K0SHJ4_9HYPO|nr:RXT2-like protein [Stachybotrys elegans]